MPNPNIMPNPNKLPKTAIPIISIITPILFGDIADSGLDIAMIVAIMIFIYHPVSAKTIIKDIPRAVLSINGNQKYIIEVDNGKIDKAKLAQNNIIIPAIKSHLL